MDLDLVTLLHEAVLNNVGRKSGNSVKLLDEYFHAKNSPYFSWNNAKRT
jgi:hypothetical protein